jgi:uncharacterized protein (TIGR03435 family)
MTRYLLRATLIACASCAAFAQTAAGPLAFEVASIKPAEPMTGGKLMVRMGGDPGRLNYSNVSLRDLIRSAYQVKDYQISGPDWLSTMRFDVVAKFPEGATRDQVPQMLQTLLAERFKLTLHREKKEMPAYALVVAKGGVKMKVAEVDPPAGDGPLAGGPAALPEGGIKFGKDGKPIMAGAPGNSMVMMNGRGHLAAKRANMQSISDLLARQLDRPVVDETSLKGDYDFDLNWTPEAGEGGGMMLGVRVPMPAGGEGGDPHGPSANDGNTEVKPPLTVAVQQQLGLKLDPKKLPVELLVIEHMEKTPTEN